MIRKLAAGLGVVCALLVFALLARRPRDPVEPVRPEPIARSLSTPAPPAPSSHGARAPAMVAARKASVSAQSEAARRAISYFHSQLMGRSQVERLYVGVKAALPPGDDSELLAVYVAEGVARNGSREFAEFMRDLHEALRDRSQALYELLSAQEASLRQDPFVYQMALNLAARLELPGEMRAQLLGDAMNIRFTPDPQTGLTAMSTNITNALILMKNYGITAEQAAPYIQLGVQTNQSDPQALSEFAARANAYYPGSVASR